jgi:asparagine synthase (glutamine-hydrolysing)
MCGICGIWGGEGGGAIEAMVSAMHHRGPDDHGFFRDDHVALGLSRLAIIDITASGHQPMSNPNQTIWIVYNGETYNFKSERELLERKGHEFASASDTEVVLRMYEMYGDDFLLRLRGMFALAIYDRRAGPGSERLLLARDHLGIKPLLYAETGAGVVFASEMKALLASGLVRPEIDAEALRQLLTFGSVQQPLTILAGVKMLPAANRLLVQRSDMRIERYWSLGVDRRPDLESRSYEQLVEELSATLQESVRLQMISDVPLGAFLSGGIDSSVLVALMARSAGRRVRTFSVGFDPEGSEIDESKEAERTAHFLGTGHTHVHVRGVDVRDRIAHIAWSLDQPTVDGVNSYFVSLAARKEVTVAISGTGGDELFAGYPWFLSMALASRREASGGWRNACRTRLSWAARQPALDPLLRFRGGGLLDALRSSADFLPRYSRLYQVFGPVGAARLLSDPFRHQAHVGASADRDITRCDELPGGSPIQRVTALCLRGYTSNQLLRDTDASSMGHSLEIRVPYLDPIVVDLALALPDSAKITDLDAAAAAAGSTYRETGSKRILIDIGRPLLPPDFDNQPKRGFRMPFDSWLRGPLQEVMADTLSDSSVRKRGWLDVGAVRNVKHGFEQSRRIQWAQPWLLMMLELWCQEVLDRSPVALASGFDGRPAT